jgi:hypothetical protein
VARRSRDWARQLLDIDAFKREINALGFQLQ